MRLLRTRFRRRRGAESNQHIFGLRNIRNQIERGLTMVALNDAAGPNRPGETNRQFAERMRAEKPADGAGDGRRFAPVTVKS